MQKFEYPVLLHPEADGGFVVTCRDLPQLVTQGDNLDAALEQASDAMDEVFATYMLEGLDFPAASKARRNERLVSPSAGAMAKASLYVAMRDSGVTQAQLARKLNIDEKEVRRLLDPHYGSKLPRISEAICALGRRMVIGLEDHVAA